MKLVEAILVGALLAALLFIAALLGATFGAFAGWVVGLLWGDAIISTLKAFGLNVGNLAMWQIGCTLGFVGAFFRSSVSTKGD
jgi:hypothetical protein